MQNGEAGYMDDHFSPYLFMGEFYPQTFERWLKVFNEHNHKYFIPEIAEKFYKKVK